MPKPQDLRARTDDSAVAVKESHNQAEITALISNLPYLYYQYEDYLGKGVELAGVMGAKATDDCPILDYYDALTRWFYGTALRMLCVNHKLECAEARIIINKYKESFDCESLLTEVYAKAKVTPKLSTSG